MKKQFAWILGGAWLVGMGVVGSMSACSGDDTTTKDSGPKDSTTPDTGNKDVATTDGPTDSGPSDVNTADCKTVPTGAPFTTDSGPFCPFQFDGGVFAACANTEHCCLPSSGASSCTPLDASCVYPKPDASSNADFVCNETNDCPNGSVCCENAGAQIQQDPGCTQYDFVQQQHGTSCVTGTACPNGQAQICGSTADCPNGKTCFPVNTKAMWLGVCQ